MLVFASPIPAAFAGIDSLQPRSVPRVSPEEQYFLTLAEEHERAAAVARQRLQQVQLTRQRQQQQQQQHELEAQIRLQQQLAAALQVRTPQRSPYHTPARQSFAHALPDMILEFDTEDADECDAYAERMHRRSQAATIERQKRAEEQAILRALFEEQRRSQAEHVAELHRKRAEEAKAERERVLREKREAQHAQARQHLTARAAEEEKLRQFFQALVGAMGQSESEEEGVDLERKNALRHNTVPIPVNVQTETPAPAPASAPVSPKLPVRAPSPAPSTTSDASDASLNSIAHLQDKFASLQSNFTFPSNPVFASTTSPAATPSLLYNAINAPVHAYENALTGLLTELDAVESFGDEHVRDVRRTLARNVEGELEKLEDQKREAWRSQRVEVESTSAPVVESAPAPVDSTPALAESIPVSALPTTIDPAAPLAWLTARLAQQSQDGEDSEVKAVREGLLAHLTTEPQSVEPTVESSESATVEPSGPAPAELPQPTTMDSSTKSEAVAVESSPEPVAEPEQTEVHTPTEVAPAPAPAPEAESSPSDSTPAHTPGTEAETVLATSAEPASAPPTSEHEPTTFVQVFPESDSDLETESDSDLVSELADRKSTSGGDGFEMI